MGENRNLNAIETRNLRKWFPVRRGLIASLYSKSQGKFIKAVDDLSFGVKKGEIFGLAGESGCGKTTLGKLLARLLKPTGGEIIFNGRNIAALEGSKLKEYRRSVQMIFQDPYESLNPRFTVLKTVIEPLEVHKIGSKEERIKRVLETLEHVELSPPQEFLNKFPDKLSGGERQRVAIARGLILRPVFLIADEPVSMLDVSIRADILALIKSLAREFKIACLFISHDLSLIRYMCDRTAIMYLGKFVEVGDTESMIKDPLHPYLKALLSAVLVPDTRKRGELKIKGEITSPINLPPGCRFRPRCPHAERICEEKEPELVKVENNRSVACHLVTRI